MQYLIYAGVLLGCIIAIPFIYAIGCGIIYAWKLMIASIYDSIEKKEK